MKTRTALLRDVIRLVGMERHDYNSRDEHNLYYWNMSSAHTVGTKDAQCTFQISAQVNSEAEKLTKLVPAN